MASSSEDDRKYDVFLSSGGEDIRRTFTDHLYCSLKYHRVDVFMYRDEYDCKLEERNGAIPEHLIQAIERSKVAVVVFSRGYPESLWCLEELVKIMECRKTLGQMFFPIFYDVDPSDVRKQRGSFKQAFKKYGQKINDDKVHVWRKALREAGDLAGLNFRQTDGHEGTFIRNVISQITGKQSITTSLEVPTSLVGIDSRVREISKHLDVGGSNDICTIGILGMCGLGKTTVAKAIFNKHHHNFDGASFLQKVREKKLVDLQEQLLSDILKPAYKGVSCIDEGTKEIEQRLGNRRVLVVIDDLDSVEQIDALAIKPDSFGPGSRIIITSRNKHLLKIVNVDKICPLPAMSEREALELLSWHAFGKNYPNKEYVELSRKAVGYCGGLPLALEVLGFYLRTKSTIEWETVLDKWNRSQPYKEIHRTLETSYDGLTDDDVKAIFLDISCFFTGMNKDYVMTVLDGCQFYPEIGIRELQDQCLVTVDKEGNLMMHDLIQSMGREIVLAESPDNPGRRSRLWHNEDITDVLMKESGTEDIEGLALDMQESDALSLSSESFRNMQSLRLLKLNNIKLTGGYHNLSKELRWLCWHGFPLEVMPKDFDQPNLAAIDLSYSKLIRVWEDSDLLLEKLKLLNLSHSHNLAQTPDFSKLPNLEELILNDCENLSEVHSSIGNLERLTLVNLEGCKKLRDLPLNFFNSKSIETLLLNGCSRFENLAEGLGKSYHKTADGTPIRQILKLSFPSQYGVESPSTSLLPPSLHGLNSLRKLDLGRCTLTDDEIPKDLGSLISLEDLDLQKNSFCSLPSLSSLSQLETLCLDDCTNLHAIPNLPTNLKVLRAGLCTALETLPDFSGLSNMRELYLSHSGKLTEIPGLDMSLNSMTRIHLEGCINLTADFRKNILQGWTSCGYGGIFLNGNYIPDWFDFVEGDLVSFHIPLIVGRNFSGLTLCFIYSSKKHHEGPLSIIVCNKTKSTALLARITYASIPTSCTLDDHYLWQGHISNYVLSLQGGDKIDIFVKPVETADASVRVKKIGVNLVWDKFMKENMHYSDLHLYDFDQHPDWLLGADGSACLASTSLSMAERGSYAQGPRLDFQQLLVEAQHRWLRPAEICEILTNFQKFCIAPEPPNKPPSGSLYLFDRNVLRYFRRDGHNWRKKRDRRTVKEGYEKLKVGGVEVLHCYYAHGEDDENFQRRCYWMLQQDLMHIVFVHYLQVKGNWLNAGGIRENDEVTSDLKKGSPWTSSPSNSNVQDDLQSQLTNAESECLTISSSEHDVPKYGNVNYAFTLRQQLLDREKGLKKVDSFSNSNVQDDLQSQLTNAESECLTISSSEHDFPKYGNVNYAFTLRQQLLDREEGLKKVDSFSRSVFKEFEEVDDLQVQSSSGIPWSMDECGDVVDGSSLSLSISQDQLFSMVDFSPKWAYTDSEIEVLVFGTFLVSQKEVTKYSWSCMFGEVEVPAQVLASGVLFCFAPPHSAGQVPFYVTCSNRLACSEVREFDYQVGSTKGLDMTDIGHGAAHEMHLHLRLESLLSLRPLSPLGQLFGGVKENQNLISKIISLKEEEDYLHAAEPTVVNYLLQNEGMEHLIKLMKEKLYTWLLYKAIEDGKGPSVLDAEGQGVLHLAAALGYDWAIKPTVTAGVSINFRDVNGWTALHWAAFCSREHTVAVLVSLGADPGALTDPSPEVPLGRTPADLASVSGHKGISGFLAESSLTTYLKSLAMNNAKEDGAAEISGTKVVKTFSERIATPLSYGDMPDALSLNDSLTSITNATQVADRIQQMFRMQSFKRRRLTEYDSDEFGMPDERAISLITSKSHKGPINGNAHTVAVQIQKKFRGWKKRKEFLIIRQRIVKIQAHVRGHQVRKQYKAITWSVGILEKAILRWRRKGTGLRGFRPDAVAKIPDPQPVASSEDDYDFLKKRKKTGEFSGYCFSERFDHGSES